MNKYMLLGGFTLALTTSHSVVAGGLWLNEVGDFSGGRASAGAVAGVDDAAATAHNPASITRLKGRQLLVSGGVFIPKLEFEVDYSDDDYGYGDGGNAGVAAPGGSAFYVHDLDSRKWSAGVYFIGLAGAGLDYQKEWVGRYQNTDSALVMVSLAPTLAYQVSDNFSVGASLQFVYSSLEVKLRVPYTDDGGNIENDGDGRAKLDGDDTELGYTLGALYEFSDVTRVGIKYQSELNPKYDGRVKIQPDDPALERNISTNYSQDFAQYIRVGIHHDINNQWAVDVTVGWDDWSVLDEAVIVTSDRTAGININWHDTYHYALGFQYKASPQWTLTSGVAYDTSPANSDDRTADLALDRQIRLNVGARYQYNDTLALGGYIGYADLGNAKIKTENWGGKYDKNTLIQISFNAEWLF